jgi:hypothetical protein
MQKAKGGSQADYSVLILPELGKLSAIVGRSVTVRIEQGHRLLEVSESIMKTNNQIFRIILDVQNIIKKISSDQCI